MTHFWEFSNSGLNLSNFHFLNKIWIQFLFSQLSLPKIMHVRAFCIFKLSQKIFLKANGYRPQFSVAAATAMWMVEDFLFSTSFSFYLQYFEQCVIFDIELT